MHTVLFKSLESLRYINVLERHFLCSPKQHLSDQKHQYKYFCGNIFRIL